MAQDLQIVFPQDLITLLDFTEDDSSGSRLLNLQGVDFRTAQVVLINGIETTQFIIVSQSTIQVSVPDVIGAAPITSVSVFSSRITLSGQSLLRFELPPAPTTVDGILRLIQVFLKILFTSPGSDIFAPNLGGGALKAIGKSLQAGVETALTADFIMSVDRTVQQLLVIQSRDNSIPASESILSATVTSAQFVPTEGTLLVSILLKNQTGQSGIVNAVL